MKWRFIDRLADFFSCYLFLVWKSGNQVAQKIRTDARLDRCLSRRGHTRKVKVTGSQRKKSICPSHSCHPRNGNFIQKMNACRGHLAFANNRRSMRGKYPCPNRELTPSGKRERGERDKDGTRDAFYFFCLRSVSSPLHLPRSPRGLKERE